MTFRRHLLPAVLVVGSACNLVENRPLTDPPVMTGSGGTAAIDHSGPTGRGGGGAGGDMGRGGAGGSGVSSVPGRTLRPRGATCSTAPVAPLVPIQPHSTVADACAAALIASTEWSYPGNDSTGEWDDRARITGRWVNCGQAAFAGPPGRGVEFGGNGRWRLLDHDASGTLVPDTSASEGGYYYVLGTGQTDILANDPSGGQRIFFAKFAMDMDALQLEDTSGSGVAVYARAEPAPNNGADNAPSVSDGRCSMVGTWDLPANLPTPQAPAAWIQFDALGNFIGAPVQSDCSGHTFYGTYDLTPGLFQLTTDVGMGLCAWWFNAAYPATFDDSCTHVTLVQHLDNCTGGRGWLNGTTTLTRRP